MALLARTLFANAVAPIMQQLDAALLKHARSAHRTLLFTIAPSASLPADDLSQLVSYFQALKLERIGALFAPMTIVDRSGHDFTRTWCSVAVFDREVATPFRSSIPGRSEAQVGRWHAARRNEDRQTDVPRPVDGSWSWNAPLHPLPDGLRALR
ncbi:hypothetical protein EIP86_010617 [Pleurotus ostreatoroseus]|nr:hypothetical protein EIP86_010617 [Pleurotus ostreatoroseus]